MVVAVPVADEFAAVIVQEPFCDARLSFAVAAIDRKQDAVALENAADVGKGRAAGRREPRRASATISEQTQRIGHPAAANRVCFPLGEATRIRGEKEIVLYSRRCPAGLPQLP